MRTTKRLAWASTILVALGLVFAVSEIAGSRVGPTVALANSTSYVDSSGESPAAPDIGTVTVSNDDRGLVSLAVRFTNRGFLGPTEWVFIDLDTDANPATGAPPRGLEYGIEVGPGIALLWRFEPQVQRWFIAPMSSLRTEWASSTLTVHINTSDLGGTSKFNFRLVADPNPDDWDAMPDYAPDLYHPLWTYEVKLAPSLAITGLDCTPEPGVRGRPLTGKATVVVTRAGKPEVLPTTATVKWTATFGKLKLKPTSTTFGATPGTLFATWKLPKAANAKVVRVTLTVTMENVTVKKTHLHRVK